MDRLSTDRLDAVLPANSATEAEAAVKKAAVKKVAATKAAVKAAVTSAKPQSLAPAHRPVAPFEPLAGPAMSAQDRLVRLATAIEADIIPRLLRLHARAQPELANAAPAVQASRHTEADVQAFARLAMSLDAAAMEHVIELLLERGVSVEVIFLELISPTARFLGTMWETDECDFVDVSIGLGRLQQAVRRLSTPQGLDPGAQVDGRRVVLMPAPGEQHTLGLSIVAEFFLRAGWDVTTALNADLADPLEQVHAEWFDVIGVSVATTARLDWLRKAIKDMRRASLNKSVGIMVGGPIFLLHPEYATELGADAFAADGLQAPIEAENLLAQRAKRT